MKKSLLLILSLFLLLVLNSEAANRYWVGGTGTWNNNAHWSTTTGGKGGASVPTFEDNVFIDNHSFLEPAQVLKIQGEAICADFKWTATNAILDGAAQSNLLIHGSFYLSASMTNNFNGKINFHSSLPDNKITTSGKILKGDLIFNGTGSWILTDGLKTNAASGIYLIKGELNTNEKSVSCGSFISNGDQRRKLNIVNSIVTIEKNWDFSEKINLEFEALGSELKLKSTKRSDFKSTPLLRYGKIHVVNKSNSISVIISQIEFNKCFGDCKAVLVATVTGGHPPYTYSWSGVTPRTTNYPTDTLKNLCAQSINILVADSTDNTSPPDYTVTTPTKINALTNPVNPTCLGACNGSIFVNKSGGTQPYSYLWTPTGQTTDTLKNACQGTYTLTITDANSCVGTTTRSLADPTLLVANGSSTNIKCFGICDGTVTTAPTGGTPPYTHSWSNGASTPSITNLCAGTYTDNIKDAKGCVVSYTAIITQPSLLSLALTKANASCGGVCDGTATATLTGGTAPYKYEWSTGSSTTTSSTTNTIIGLCAGTYSVTITDKNNCVRTGTIIVTEPPVLNATASATNITCNAVCNGTATVVVTGGTAPYTYLWTPGNPTGTTTPTITNLCPNTYSVTVRDANNCVSTSVAVITQPAVLNAVPSSTNVSCFDACNGTATAGATGGTTPYTYRWLPILPPATSPTITNLCPGTYSLVVTDANNCKDTSSSFTITQPPVLAVNAASVNITCNGVCNGTATANPTGGVAPYSYSWTPGLQTTKTITGLCVGNYTVTVTDANGCTRSQVISITQPNTLNVSLASTSITCNSVCNATITSTVSGGTPGYLFSWAPGGETTANISNKCAGTYTLTVTDNLGCIRTATRVITQPTLLSLSTGSSDVTCFGQCNGNASAIAGGGTAPYTYSWAPGNQTTSSISSLCAGTYTVTARDAAGCTQTKTVTINQPAQLFANPLVVDNASCSGVCNGSAIATPIGGTAPFAYSWSPGGATTATVANLCQGTYSVRVTDANNCVSNQSVTITQPTPVSATISSSTSSCNICNGSATATAGGGTGPYTYSWAPGGQTTATATGLCPNTTYTVIVTDSKGCTSTASVTILQTIIINITTSSTVLSCAGKCDGIVTANASGGTLPYSFLWAGPGGPYSTQTVTNLCAGTYTVTVSDAAGCFNSDVVTFTNPPALTVNTTTTNVSCAGSCNGSATATPAGGTGTYTYDWSPGGQTTQTATSLCVGSYTVTVTDAKGCVTTSVVAISGPTAITDQPIITKANCTQANGAITVSPTGGVPPFTYDWGPGTPTGDGTPSITNLLPGPYTLEIRDNTGCIVNFNYLVNNDAGPSLAVTHANVSCHDACDGSATVVASGGIPGYTYLWSPGNTTGTSISSVCGTTTYTIQVTDAAMCISFDTATIINPPVLALNEAVVNESCGGTCDGTITLNPSGGKAPYTYSWNTGSTSSTLTGLCAGNYTVTVKDANNCITVLTIPVLSPPALSVTLASTDVKCNGTCSGTATATVTGGTGAYTYSWTNQPVSVVLPAIVNLCPNQYIVTVQDAKGCIAKDTVIIAEPPVLTSSATKKDLSCHGVCNGMAIVSASGGVSPYTYVWNPGNIANDTASALCAGTYTAAVIDANGCFSFPAPVTIMEPAIIAPNVTFTNPLCNASCNGTAVSNPSGGTGSYSYEWTPGGFTTKNILNLCAGTYTITVKDSMGCAVDQNVTLINPTILSANTTSASPSCVSACDGTVTATPVGGTPGYTYHWTPGGATTQNVTNVCAGSYTVIVSDANNCKDTQNVTVVNPLPLNVAVSTTPSSCGSCDGTITVSPVTGISPFTYNWSGGLPPLSNQTNVCAGIYTVTVTDAVGCDSTFTIAINNSNGPTGETVVTTAVTCYGQCNGTGTVTPIGGTPPYTYTWNNTPPSTTNTATNLCAGSYLVEIKDSNTCLHYSPVVITEPNQIRSNETITSATCSGVCTGNITVAPTGGTGINKYTYLWAPGGQITSSVGSLCPGTYTLTITDSISCTQEDTFVVGQTSPLTVNVVPVNITCSSSCNGMAYIQINSGTPPYSIQWNDPMAQTTDTAKSLCAGNYSVSIRDALGCSVSLNVTITNSTAIAVAPVITPSACGVCDGQAAVTTTGGQPPYIYSWSNGQSTATATGLCAGLYTLLVKDNLGCEANVSIPVNNINGPTAATIASTNVTCYGLCDGAITAVTPVGGTPPYTYLWIPGGQTTAALSNLCAGTYYVKITDNAGCSRTDSVTIASPPPFLANQTVKIPSCTVCDGEISIAPSGGVPPYSISWNTGSTSANLTNLCAGIYTVQIADATCSQSIAIPLNTKNGPSLTTTSTNIACNDSCNGTAKVIATGGVAPYTIAWNTGAITDSIGNLCPGNYLTQVKGADGCASSASVTITQQPSVFITLGSVGDPLCNGDANGTITVVPTGGTFPYSYTWTPALGTGPTLTSLPANTYSVTVTDLNGCTASQSITLVEPPVLTISHVTTSSTCNTVPDASIDVTTAGGTLPYVFQWSGSSTANTEDLTNVLSGSYTITVTDQNGCRIKDSMVVSANQSVFAKVGNDTSFCQASSFTLNASASINAVNFKWYSIPTNTLIANTPIVVVNPPVGTSSYYVVVDNGTGCSASDTITLTSNALPDADAGPDKKVYIGNSTVIGGSPTTSTPGATLVWSPSTYLDDPLIPNPVSTPQVTTVYTVTVTSLQGCISVDTVVVNLQPTIEIPSGITPNGDGKNDIWILNGIELFPDCTVELYNRWGEMIFQSPGYNKKWDGTYKGKMLPVGTYYYIIDLGDPAIPVYTGSVTIMR